jgi:hypothetical protein
MFCYSLGGNGSGGNNFAATTIVVSLHSLINAMQKEERENDKQKGINIDKEKKIAIAFRK